MSVIHLSKENFNQEVLGQKGAVLVDFWATWCPPCRMLSPIIDEIAEEVSDIRVGKINVDEQPELAAQFQISNIPTLIVFKDGKETKRSVGAISKDAVKDLIQ